MPHPGDYLRLQPTQFTDAFYRESKATLPNTQKQTQKGCRIETKKHGPNETAEQNPRKRTKQNGDNQPKRCRVQITGDQTLKELTEYSNDIKKTQEEMKITLSEIKKNLQGINSEGDEAENQINDLEHKEEKKQLIRTRRRKENPKKIRIV